MEPSHFDEVISQFQTSFEHLRNWISWWTRTSIAAMIFPSRMKMSKELVEQLPRTSNPIETQHSLLHHGSGKNHEVLKGFEMIHLHVEGMRRQFEGIINGEYKASKRIGTVRRTPPPCNFVNDGRPEDPIIPIPSIPPQCVASKQTTTPTRSGPSRPSNQPITLVPTPQTSHLDSALSTDKSNNGDYIFHEHAGIRPLQSYQFLDNSCWIDTALELWFRAYITWPPSAREEFPKTVQPQDAALTSIGRLFRRRLAWILSPQARTSSVHTSRTISETYSASDQEDSEYLPSGSSKLKMHTEARCGRTQGSARSMRKKPTTRNTTKVDASPGSRACIPSKNKGKGRAIPAEDAALDPALEAGLDILRTSQLAAWAASKEWNLYSRGSFGDSRLWMTRAIEDGLDISTELQFAIRHQVTSSCLAGHTSTTPEDDIFPFLYLNHDDIAHTIAMLPSSTVQRPSLNIGTVLSHYLARRKAKPKGINASHKPGGHILTLPLRTCTIERCQGVSTTTTTIETSWPRVLHIVPDTVGSNMDTTSTSNESTLPSIDFAIEFEIATLSSSDVNYSPVRYRMIGRQLFHSSASHYTAELLLQDATYRYDDRRDHGRLHWAGNPTLISTPKREVTFVVYSRISGESHSSHDAAYLSLAQPSAETQKQKYSEVQDLTIASPSTITSVESPATSLEQPLAILKRRQASACLNEQVPAVAADSAVPAVALQDSDGLDDFLRGINRHPEQLKDLLASRQTTHTLECVACSIPSEQSAEQIRCSTCFLWSHVACMKLQFGLRDSVLLDAEVTWSCPGRCNKSIPLWTDDLVGNYIYLPITNQGKESKKRYAVKILERNDMHASVEWYYGNIYAKGESPNAHDSSHAAVPIHRCADAMAEQRKRYQKHQLGALRWPMRLCDDAADLREYKNDAITRALEESFHSVHEILMGRRTHAVIADFVEFIGKGKRPKSDRVSNFVQRYGMDLLAGELSLLGPYIRDMELYLRLERSNNIQTAERIPPESLAWGPGMLLFTLVVFRLYAGRSAEDDDQIYRLIASSIQEVEQEMKDRAAAKDHRDKQRKLNGPTESGEDEVSEEDEPPILPRYRLFRQWTAPEQALAARFGRTKTNIDPTEDPCSRIPQYPKKNMINMRDKSFVLEDPEPIALVWAREDMPPYFWTKSTTRGLVGGPLYVPYSISTSRARGNSSTHAIPKPRPTAVRRKRANDGPVEVEGQGGGPAKRHKT